VSALLSLALAAGCAQDVPDVPVVEQWTKTINNYSFIPVYPMREDVYVGDVRLTVPPDSLMRGQLGYRRLGYVEMRKEMEDFYRSRPTLPPTLVEVKDGKSTLGKQPTANGSIFDTGENADNINRLRLAALPGIKVATIYQGQIGGRVPTGAANLGFGVTGRNGRVLDITLTGIEELEAPSDLAVRKKFMEYCKTNPENLAPDALDFALTQLLNSAELETASANAGSPEKGSPRAQVVVITRVLYARSIDYTFSTEQGYAADLAAVTGSITELSSLVGKLPDSGAPGGQDGGDGPAAEEPVESGAEAAAALVNSISGASGGLLSSVSGSTAPGIVAKAVFVDSRGITLRETFERPMAFAVQAIGFNASTPEARKSLCSKPTPQLANPEAHR
jgi:hypothetical protein